jgi:archaellum component FlaF (FlaF/FlaG flagellin family)
VIKLIVKLALAALIANAAWRLGTAYLSFYKFKDAVQEATQFGADKGDTQLQTRILELASDYDVPLTPDGFTIQHKENHTIVDGSYVRTVDLFPGYKYQCPFAWHTDAFTIPQR